MTETEQGRGYDAALDDVAEWLTQTTDEWHGLQIVSDNQMLALKDLVHAFDLRFQYVYRGSVENP